MDNDFSAHRQWHWSGSALLKLLLLLQIAAAILVAKPGWSWALLHGVALPIGIVAAWRYSWWLIHFIRAQIYGRVIFPSLRARAEQLWQSGWRSDRVTILMVTYMERPETTEKVLQSIIDEAMEANTKVRLFIGTGQEKDEIEIETALGRISSDVELEVLIVRQKKPGKRAALGDTLRAISRAGVERDEPIIFMDGDTYLTPGTFRKCLPLFAVLPLDALTTDEKDELHGPKWLHHWLELRFTQRHMVMQSHSVSKKLLVLTGRFSIFRSQSIINEDFINIVEADFLDHWLWGKFSFLSGDDKSTWYALLRRPGGATITYVPDALVVTIDYVTEKAADRMKNNLWRWSGNTLRNGTRALALGPRQIGFFIWWCVLDQRISMWASLYGLVASLVLTIFFGFKMLIAYLSWVLFTRILISLVLFCYARQIYFSFPFLLYVNQVTNAAIKVYAIFRLSKQRWSNRGNQRVGPGQSNLARAQNIIALYLNVFYVTLFVFVILLHTDLLHIPNKSSVLKFIQALGFD